MEKIIKYLEDNLEVVCNAAVLSNEEYALIRKDSLGASDASVVLGVNLYKNKDQLIKEKRSKFLTEEEKEIGTKVAVRKGKDLEALNLEKFNQTTGLEVIKPPFMYKHKTFRYLTTNFDGIAREELYIPVEAKLVTKFGEKYYKKHMPLNKEIVVAQMTSDIIEHIKYWADKCGVPPYYYTQVQQQILFLDSEEQKTPYGYLSCLFDDSWDYKYFYIPRDEFVISHLISDGAKLWEKIEA